jgi:hypothetical protein
MLNTIIAQHGVSAAPFFTGLDTDHERFIELYMKAGRMPKDVEPWHYMNAMQKVWGEWYMRERGLGDWVDSRPSNAIMAEYCDLWFLYNYIRQVRPQRVLELGGGCSTAIIAMAMNENRCGTLWSVDESEAWARAAWEPLPPELRRRVYMHHTPVIVEDKTAHYQDIPKTDPQFIYVDGPNLKKWASKLKPDEIAYQEIILSDDMVRLEPFLTPGCAVLFDQRNDSVQFLLKTGRRNWLMLARKLWRNWYGVLIS